MSRTPIEPIELFKGRRSRLAPLAADAAVLLVSTPEAVRNYDVYHPFRQDSDFFYLTGWEEPESVFLYRPGKTPETVMFVRKKDVERETWDGFRYGPDGCRTHFGIDEVHLIDELEEKLPKLLSAVSRVYYRTGVDREMDQRVLRYLEAVRRLSGRTGVGSLPLHDSRELIGELRVIKTEDDLAAIRKATSVTARGHLAVMRAVRAGATERQMLGVFLGSIYAENADREGYGSIVAGGANACTLHYTFNDQRLNNGDLLLIDAGAEVRYYCGDITRTYPVNGKFTSAQREVYDRVLDCQKQLIEMVKPGIEFSQLQTRTIEMLTEAMLDLKLLKVSRDEAIETLAFKKYYPHGVSHFLGMDVHDSGLYGYRSEASKGGLRSRLIEPGMVFTIEPGLYIPKGDEAAPAHLRGIGVRIEDDIAVTVSGCENLTAEAPKEVADLEGLIGK